MNEVDFGAKQAGKKIHNMQIISRNLIKKKNHCRNTKMEDKKELSAEMKQ